MTTFLKLAWSYFKIGLFGFGGGYAMLSLIEREIVGNGWITPTAFTDIVAISQMTPGPIGINSATYIGYVVGGESAFGSPVLWGIVGALICTLVVVIPSFVMVITASRYIEHHRESAFIQGMFRGLRPVVPGLIAAAALLLMNSDNFGTDQRDVCWSVGICVVSFLLAKFTSLHPIFIIVAMGVVGYFVF